MISSGKVSAYQVSLFGWVDFGEVVLKSAFYLTSETAAANLGDKVGRMGLRGLWGSGCGLVTARSGRRTNRTKTAIGKSALNMAMKYIYHHNPLSNLYGAMYGCHL
ncbi:hypothetical protein [Vogesella alkaliphila]|uniref:Uncharacterized protein n=1 Tax=Vogesella alkaliphila TaxID=1193621 RepID=A0ABQ2YDK3_9NEIS|nr:hypothetical protein [Vogesella alkaliphila]GGX80860.1 hypothetical protein GCM10011290_05740 [Vogesella alkaliphila]